MRLPVFGALFYWYIQSDIGHKAMKRRVDQLVGETRELAPQSSETLEGLAARVCMDILNRSGQYVYIMTPYLILDGEMETAVNFADERGVDVRLILPGIPDKAAPYALAKILDSGIKIYEYMPGFVHAKVFLADARGPWWEPSIWTTAVCTIILNALPI